MSERVKPERVKCQRTLPAELSSPSDAAISRLPMSARRSFGATDASHRTARVGKSGVAWGAAPEGGCAFRGSDWGGRSCRPVPVCLPGRVTWCRGSVGRSSCRCRLEAQAKRKRVGSDGRRSACVRSVVEVLRRVVRYACGRGNRCVDRDHGLRFRRILRRGRPFSHGGRRFHRSGRVRAFASVVNKWSVSAVVSGEFPGPHRQMEPNRGPSARIRTLVAELVPGVGGPRPKLLVL